MQLNKTGIDSGKTVELPVKQIHQAKTQSPVNTKIIETQAARSITALIKSAGLPQDKLSASVLSFARFFSLALKPEQLASIRRQAFVQQQTAQQPANNAEALKLSADISAEKTRAAFSLAAAAAESKGVELQPKGLESYAEAVDPDSHKRQDGEKDGKRQKKQNEQEEKDGINAVNIKKLALETAENNPVLAIMNKLPSKEGQRWIVLPFEFSQDSKNFLVSMRILIDRDNAIFMAVNVQVTGNKEQVTGEQRTENREQTKGRWSFALEFVNNKVSKLIYYQSENSSANKEQIKKELAKHFELPIDNVFVKTDESLPEADYGEELLKFIDEAC